MEEKMLGIIKSLNDMETTQKKLISIVNEQNKYIKSFNERFDGLSDQISKLSENCIHQLE